MEKFHFQSFVLLCVDIWESSRCVFEIRRDYYARIVLTRCHTFLIGRREALHGAPGVCTIFWLQADVPIAGKIFFRTRLKVS